MRMHQVVGRMTATGERGLPSDRIGRPVGRARTLAVASGIALLLAADLAAAQWVIVARKAIGKIEQISQQQAGNGPSYDSAAVMIDAPADRVYAAVVRGVRDKQGITVTREDAASRLVQFTDGRQVAGIKVSALSDELSHLLVSSAYSGSQPSAAALVSEAVLRVCREMNIECSRAAQ